MQNKLNFNKDIGLGSLVAWIHGRDACYECFKNDNWWEAHFWDGETKKKLTDKAVYGTDAMAVCEEHFDANND
jgi:hypothetical protein